MDKRYRGLPRSASGMKTGKEKKKRMAYVEKSESRSRKEPCEEGWLC